MAVTDLTGTKWKFNSSVTKPASDGWVVVSDSYIEDSQNRFYSDSNKRFIMLHNGSGYFGAFTSSVAYYERPGIFNWNNSWRKATTEASSSETNAVGDVVLYIGQCDNTQSYYQNFVQWLQLNATQIIEGYSITYYANGGTPEPENLTDQTNLPSPLPTVSKPNFTFDGWYTDSAFTTPAVAGAAISADTDLYAKFTRSHITLDLSTIGLSEGTHSIQMKLSDGGVTKRDSELSNAVQYTVARSGYTITINNIGDYGTYQIIRGSETVDYAVGANKGSHTYNNVTAIGIMPYSTCTISNGTGNFVNGDIYGLLEFTEDSTATLTWVD